ncbi:MAG: zinc ribbon domain-containing protein, partial [Acidobacteria bacterium]
MTSFQPWQFFVLAGLAAATAGVFVSRGTSPANVVFISIIIGAAALAGTAVYRMLLPLVVPEAVESVEMIGGRTRAALEREKLLVLRAIKELEFDRAMNKISAQDYDEMVARLRSRAVRLMRQLDAGGSGYRELIERELAGRLGRAAAGKNVEPADESETATTVTAGACASCGTLNETDARFCKHCGSRLVAGLVLILALLVPFIALAQPELRMMAGIPRPDGNLPDGVVTVRVVRQSLANNVTDQAVELLAGDQTLTARTDANGRATFRPPTVGAVIRAATVVDGERLESQEFPAPARGGVAVMLVAGLGAAPPKELARPGTVTMGGDSRFVIDLVDDSMQVYYILEVFNAAAYPVNPPRPVILDLPSGAAGAAALGNSSSQVVVRGDRVTVTGPFEPGVTPVQVGFTLPHSRGNLRINQTLPVELAAVN